MKKSLLFLLLVIGYLTTTFGQELLEPASRFSGKKPLYITLMDGTEITGTLKDLDRKKGLITQVTIRDENGKKKKFKPEEIKFMYLMPSGFDKYVSAVSLMSDANKWGKSYVKPGLISEGYAFFEQSKVQVKKKERVLLMQVLNPTFGGDIRIYHDPFAKETASVGFAGVKVAGGIAKSYYIRFGDNTAYRLKKKDYKKLYPTVFSDCKKMSEKFPKISWEDLAKHVAAYAECKD